MQRPFSIFVVDLRSLILTFFDRAREAGALKERRFSTAEQKNGALESAAPCSYRRVPHDAVPAKNKSLRWLKPPERLQKSFVDSSLANLGSQEFAVVFDADASTGQEVGHCRNRFFGILGARANGNNKVSEREFGTRFEDLFGRFHDQS